MGYLPQFLNGDATPLGTSLVTATPTQSAARDLLGLGVSNQPQFNGLNINAAAAIRWSQAETGSTNRGAIIGNANLLQLVMHNTPGLVISESPGTRVKVVNELHLGPGVNNNVSNLVLAQDASDILAQRRGTNAQTFNLYKTYTSSTNFERLQFDTTGDAYRIGSAVGSAGGVSRSLSLGGYDASQVWTNRLVLAESSAIFGGASVRFSPIPARNFNIIINSGTRIETSGIRTSNISDYRVHFDCLRGLSVNLGDGAPDHCTFDVRSFSGTRLLSVGNGIFMDLPTSDPVVAGRIWNDNGTLKISAG